MAYYVYLLSNNTNTTIYIGVTNDLVRRIYEHKHHMDPDSFSARYHVYKLVYYEQLDDIHAALAREKQVKSWNRARKNRLISASNPEWRDLYSQILL